MGRRMLDEALENQLGNGLDNELINQVDRQW
jgi:hypothetical protein